MIRDDIKAALVNAMKSGDKQGTAAIRLIQAAIKNRDIELRTAAQTPDDDVIVTEVLQKMIKQRRESLAIFEKAGRKEQAQQEATEIAVIEEFLPKQMSETEAKEAVAAVVKEVGAASPKEMGKVMAVLKERYAGRIDFGKASALVKELLK